MDEQRIKAYFARRAAEQTQVVCDTVALAAEHGVRIGTTVIVRKFPVFRAGPQAMQESLDDYFVAEMIHRDPSLLRLQHG